MFTDDDWNASPLEEPVFATKPAHDYPLPRIRRQDSGVDSNSSPVHASPEKEYYYGSRQEQCTNPVKRQTTTNAQQIAPNLREKYSDRNVALVQPRPRKCEMPCGKKSAAPPAVLPAEFARKPAVEVRRQRTPSPNRSVRETPRERFKDAKEKFLMLEKERMDEQRSALKKCMERQRRGNVVPAVIRSAVRGSCEWSSSRGGSDDDGGNDETNGNRYNYNDDDDDDDFDGKGLMNNAKRSNRSRESLDKDYNNSSYSKPISNRRSRNSQVNSSKVYRNNIITIKVYIYYEGKSKAYSFYIAPGTESKRTGSRTGVSRTGTDVGSYISCTTIGIV